MDKNNYLNEIQPNRASISESENSPLPHRTGFLSSFGRTFANRKRIAAILLLIVLAAFGYWVYQKYFHLSASERAARELAATVASISKLMLLPEGDQPMLATVVDAKELKKEQPFFARADNGDRLLLFPRNLQAVLYRPRNNLIVNVGPIQYQNSPTGIRQDTNVNQPSKQEASAQPATTSLSVEIRNGSGKTGQGATLAENLKTNPLYHVIGVGDAKRKDYQETIIVDLHGKGGQELVNTLALALNARVVKDFPEGETDSKADAVIILGAK